MIIELTYSEMSHNSGEFLKHDLQHHTVKILILVYISGELKKYCSAEQEHTKNGFSFTFLGI